MGGRGREESGRIWEGEWEEKERMRCSVNGARKGRDRRVGGKEGQGQKGGGGGGARKGRDRRVGCHEQGLPDKCLTFPSMNIS